MKVGAHLFPDGKAHLRSSTAFIPCCSRSPARVARCCPRHLDAGAAHRHTVDRNVVCSGPLACPRPADPKAHGADAHLAEIEVATSADRREIDWFLLAHGLSSSLARGSGPRSPLEGEKAETKNPSGCGGVSRPWLLRHKPYRPRFRAGIGTLAASPGCRALHRARTLCASLDSYVCYLVYLRTSVCQPPISPRFIV